RAEDDVAAGAATFHPRAVRIGVTGLGEVLRRRDAICPVDLAPAAVEEAPVLAPVAGAAAVVHVDDADPALREVLDIEPEMRRHVRGRAAVARDLERRGLVVRAFELRARG